MNTQKQEPLNKLRLSDSLLQALEQALEQDDVAIAEMLVSPLELAMTRNAGGQDFVERRDYPERLSNALEKLDKLKNK